MAVYAIIVIALLMMLLAKDGWIANEIKMERLQGKYPLYINRSLINKDNIDFCIQNSELFHFKYE
jgi:hypothetical protein